MKVIKIIACVVCKWVYYFVEALFEYEPKHKPRKDSYLSFEEIEMIDMIDED